MQVSTCWTEGVDTAAHESIRDELALVVADYYLGNHRWRDLIGQCITRRDYASLLAIDPGYRDNPCPLTLVGLRQVQALYSKDPNLEMPGFDRQATAIAKWEEAERLCRLTNLRLRASFSRDGTLGPDFEWARRWLARALGPCPSLDGLKFRFGPGATTEVKRRSASLQYKLAAQPTCSLDLLASGLLPSILREMPHYSAAHAVGYSIDDEGYLVEELNVALAGGRSQFVPKNFKEFRTIDSQPTINGLLQNAIGDYIAGRLLKVGLNLRDQSINQRLARSGSMGSPIATLDLTSASDTICTYLVKWLLPRDWFRLLSAARCGTTYVPGKGDVVLEKFMAMGNGFSFALESAIFYALNLAVHSRLGLTTEFCNTFGDDITCHSSAYATLVDVLTKAGFWVNLQKSYADGPFRESCGADFYKGIDIRPFYLKKRISGETLFTMHNYFARVGCFDLANVVKRFIPTSLRLYGPDGYGDGHLVSYEWRSREHHPDRGYGGRVFSTFSLKPRKLISVYPGDYISPLFSIYIRDGDSDLDNPGTDFSRDGRPLWPAPDSDGYAKVSIYYFG